MTHWLLDQRDYKNYKYYVYLQSSVDYEKEITLKYLLEHAEIAFLNII